ncbi:response regulator [Propionibacteriaceae bacterium Y2011]|uniref:response regulator n=1 Tax=Microlunatus sp. Y2014 TaxID=3418488 RepID=UPI003B4D56AF
MNEPDGPAPAVLRLMLVDDHPVVRRGLRAVFDDQPDVRVVAEAADGAEAITVLNTVTVDVILMDLQMSGMDGVATTRALQDLPGSPPVLVLTTYDADVDILAALDAGAKGYLLKDARSEVIIAAARRAADGKLALSPDLAARVQRHRENTTALSPRQIEICRALAEGLTNKQIAQRLFISEATVKTHLVHIFDKLGVDNRTSAIAEADRRRLLSRR